MVVWVDGIVLPGLSLRPWCHFVALWHHLATEMRSRHLQRITSSILLADPKDACEPCMAGIVVFRTVVQLECPLRAPCVSR